MAETWKTPADIYADFCDSFYDCFYGVINEQDIG